MRKNLTQISPSASLALDGRDRQLLKLLQDDGRATNASLAQAVHLAEAPTWRRVRQLEAAGAIRGYRAVVDPRALGYEVLAFVHVRFSSHDPKLQRAFEEDVLEIPQVLWCHNVSGATDFLLCAVARNLREYGEFISTRIRSMRGVASIESSFSLKEVKESGPVPVE